MSEEQPIETRTVEDAIAWHEEMINSIEAELYHLGNMWERVPEHELEQHESHIELLRSECSAWYVALEVLKEEKAKKDSGVE